jgi:regulator of protease activity HflC (stomatin/prohibitin superfamily)
MLVLILLRLIAFVVLVGAIALIGQNLYAKSSGNKTTPIMKLRWASLIALGSFIGLGVLMSAVYIPATSKAVVENTVTGNFKVIGSGIHIWPLQPDLIPFASKTTKYSMRQQRIEIGTDEAESGQVQGISAGSDSPGNPAVYIQARGWATPNTDFLIELHRRYGSDYADTWVERNWVTAVKTVQGKYPYDYLINNRQAFADEVEKVLQEQLFDNLNQPLVEVSQLAVTNFDFSANIQSQLDSTAQKQFETQRAKEQVEIARQEQEKVKVDAESRLLAAKKDAETQVTKAQAEAQAIRLVNEAIQAQGAAYLQYQWIQKWSGNLPQFQAGESSNTLFQVPLPQG